MKKSNGIIICSIVLVLLCSFEGYFNNSSVISKEKAEHIAANFIKIKNLGKEGETSYSKAYLTSDLHSMVFRHRRWIIEVDDQDWLYINAYSGKVIKEENHYMESFYVAPGDYEEFKKHFCWFLIFNYGISVYAFITRYKYKFSNFIFTIAAIHLITSIVFINIISWIYLWIIMVVISLIFN